MDDARPPKRARQACEPCRPDRRKKSRCPGQKPTCALCARLRQQCVYGNGRPQPRREVGDQSHLERRPQRHDSIESQSTTVAAPAFERRLGSLEHTLAGVLERLGEVDAGQQDQRDVSTFQPQFFTTSTTPSRFNRPSVATLPPWGKVLAVAKLYQTYCDCQPLPLFQRDTFPQSMEARDPEVVYAILALAIRFSDDPYFADDVHGMSQQYFTIARRLVMDRVTDGPVELSTLQTFCLLVLIDSYNGNINRARLHMGIASSLAYAVKLHKGNSDVYIDQFAEERSRCLWSMILLGRLFGFGIDIICSQPQHHRYPPVPATALTPTDSPTIEAAAENSPAFAENVGEDGIVSIVIHLGEVWAMAANYIKSHGQLHQVPPWSLSSEYSKTMACLMKVSTKHPARHRFRSVNLRQKSPHALENHREYWAPWFLTRFLYHTTICILNHPLLITLQLRDAEEAPEIFLQQLSSLLSHHTNWVLHLISIVESKDFKITDPFIGYCAAVIATIEIHLGFPEDPNLRQSRHKNFTKCLEFIHKFGAEWPHILRLAEKLQAWKEAISSSYQSNLELGDEGLTIDLTLYWDILEYPFSEESGLTSRNSEGPIFGQSLAFGLERSTAISNLPKLPSPTQIDNNETGDISRSSNPASQHGPMEQPHDMQISPTPSDILTMQNSEFFLSAAQVFNSQTAQELATWWIPTDM